MRIIKFETMIDDIQGALEKKAKPSSFLRRKTRTDQTVTEDTALSSALGLIYDYEKLNDYGKVIIKHSSLFLTQGDSFEDVWTPKYPDVSCFDDLRYKINAAKEFIKLCRLSENNDEAYKFIFWAMLILTVDKNNAEEKLSLICDFTRMLNISDDEVLDILLVIKIILHKEDYEPIKTQSLFGVSIKQGKFKTDKVKNIFLGIFNECVEILE